MFQRIVNLIKGFLSLFISGIERRNPEALLEVEKENLRKQIAQYNQGLASHAGLCERLMSQVKKLEKDQTDLRAKTAANLKVGNRAAAAQYAAAGTNEVPSSQIGSGSGQKADFLLSSEDRRVGKEGRSRWAPDH